MIRPAPRALLFSMLVGAVANGGCTTDHDALARQPNKAGTGGGGVGGVSGTGGSGGGGEQASQGGRVNPDVEPEGDNVLTIVNGIVDAPSVRLCFASVGDNGATSKLRGDPLPELAYSASTVLTELDGFSFADDVLEPWVIVGDLSLVEKLDCRAAVELAQTEEARVTPDEHGEAGAAGAAASAPLEAPALRARALAALPAGTVTIGRSILMVLTGCVGGAAYSDVVDIEACGDDYTPMTPTAQPIVVKLSREHSPLTVGLQGVHASLPTLAVDIREGGGETARVFAGNIAFGAIEPRPADVRFTPDDLGVSARDHGLQAVGDQGIVVLDEEWAKVFAASGIDPLQADRTYTAILLGPNPRLTKRGFWNDAAFAIVDNDPTRKSQ
ncbi:MAG TPA: hypothetical protein VEQ59_14035 [Polyangiaceae bacterium]|nr:hypothetical protein [Polyangiaceae bacterium]